MDDNYGEWVECMGAVRRRWMLVESMGVVAWKYIVILTPIVSALFAAFLLFVHF